MQQNHKTYINHKMYRNHKKYINLKMYIPKSENGRNHKMTEGKKMYINLKFYVNPTNPILYINHEMYKNFQNAMDLIFGISLERIFKVKQ